MNDVTGNQVPNTISKTFLHMSADLFGLGLYAFVDHQNVMVAVSNWW
jgi:hypothetical protein